MASEPPPASYGVRFTKTIHNKAEGPTDPKNNRYNGEFVVCITGAGKGLGFYELSVEIKKVNPKVEILSQICDTTVKDYVEQLLHTVKDKFGRVDVVVANPGVISQYPSDGSLPKGIASDFDVERAININFFLGSMRLARLFTPFLLESKGGQTFIVITSLASHFENSQLTPIAYNTSNRAVCQMIESMAHEHRKQGLLAYAVDPAAVVTPQTKQHSLETGELSDTTLTHEVCGGFLTWLTRERRDWLSGRYIPACCDVDELESMEEGVVK